MKQLSRFEMAAVKRTAQNTKMLVKKLDKVNACIVKLANEKVEIETQIAEWEAPIVNKYGYKSDELIAMEGNIPEICATNDEGVTQVEGSVDMPADVL